VTQFLIGDFLLTHIITVQGLQILSFCSKDLLQPVRAAKYFKS